MKIIIDIKSNFKFGEVEGEITNKEGLTINEVDEVVDELQEILPSDILTILDGGVLVRNCQHNKIVMRRDWE